MKIRARKTRSHTNISATAFAYIEEIMKRDLVLGRNFVFDAAATYIKTIENKITTEIVKETLRETSGDAKVLFHPTMTDAILDVVKRIAEKHKLNKGEAMEIIINLYMKKYKAANGESLKIKKVIEPKIANFNLERSADKILFALYVRYPDVVSYSELLGLMPEAGLVDSAENSEIEFKAELQLYVKKGYIQMIRSGAYIRYIITEFGISYLVKKAVVDVQARISSMIVALRGHIERGEGFRYEKVLYELLTQKEHKLSQSEIVKRTEIESANIANILKELNEKKLVFIIKEGRGKQNTVILDINKILRDGLPPRNNYEWRIIKTLIDNNDKVHISTLNRIFDTRNKAHLHNVLNEMQKKGKIDLDINLGRKGTTIKLTENGKSYFDVYNRKNIPLKPLEDISNGSNELDKNSHLGCDKEIIVKIIRKRIGMITGIEEIKKSLEEESIVVSNSAIKRLIGFLKKEGCIKESYVLTEKAV